MQATIIRGKNIRCRPTGYGLLFGVVVAAMMLGSLNYNNNLGLLFALLLGGMAMISWLHTYRNLAGLQIISAAARPVFAGEIAVYEIGVRSEAPSKKTISFSFMRSGINCQDRIAHMPRRLSLHIPVEQRGRHNPGPLKIETRYPLGLFRAAVQVSLDIHCLVYPKPISAPFAALKKGASSGNQGGREIAGIDDFKGLQPYLPGEPVEHIYWKAFSRGQGLQIKQFAESAGALIVFDFNSIKGVNVEQKLSRLCDAVLKAHRFNLLYGLNLPGNSIAPDTGNTHRHNCLKALALFQMPSGAGIS